MARSTPTPSVDWNRVQKTKQECLELAAQHAMEQQKRNQLPVVAIPFPEGVTGSRKMKLLSRSPEALRIEILDVLTPYSQAMEDTVRFRLERPLNLLDGGSGLAVLVESDTISSHEVRLGVRLIGAGGAKTATILPYVPVVNAWGDNPHEIYFDWSFINYANVGEAIAVLRAVEAIEFLAGSALRAPERGASRSAQCATVTLSRLRLVDYLQGSYDPARHRWTADQEPDLTLQHRCQEVTGLVAGYGGAAGRSSARESLDLCLRTQCWDGSFLDGRRGARTVTSGEYTYGFTLYGTLTGYLALEKARVPELEEKIAVGPRTLTRRDAYLRMFYRAAMSRAGIAQPPEYRDDVISSNTLITGANRVMGYALAMHMVADALKDEAQQRKVLAAYNPLMDLIVEAQGKFSGGFPVLAEGDRYQGAGIHYDASYIRTHMDWLIVGAQRTGDPRFVQILRRYQEVFEAVMDERGTGVVPLLSERGQGRGSVRLIVPDSTAQVGMKERLPIIAQWGYNCSLAAWQDPQNPRGNFWIDASRMRGYSLGAFAVRLIDDFRRDPQPRDLGYLFPRQFPLWSAQLFTKAGQLVRTSRVHVRPDGTLHNDFVIQVGEYPKTVGVPVTLQSPGGTVLATALELSGWPKLLPEKAEFTIMANGAPLGRCRADEPVRVAVREKTVVTVTGPDVKLPPEAGGKSVPFRAAFSLEPEEAGRTLAVSLRVHRGTVAYAHEFPPPRTE